MGDPAKVMKDLAESAAIGRIGMPLASVSLVPRGPAVRTAG
jgi:hypothetical protein